jgi:SPX domain protein involved in polyphosphate accumulation
MKFAKTLQRVVQLAAPFCEESAWLDYKALKKALHGCERKNHPLALSDSPAEVHFFALLSAELKKIALFYASKEEDFAVRFAATIGRCRDLLAASLVSPRPETELVEALSEVTRLYMALLQLENFAVMK